MRSKWSQKCLPRLIPILLRKFIEIGPPRTSKTMIPAERGTHFHEIQGPLKALHFDSILDVFWSSLGTIFCSFTLILRVRKQVQKNSEKVSKKCSEGSPGGPKGAPNSIKHNFLVPKMELEFQPVPGTLPNHQNTPQCHLNDSKMRLNAPPRSPKYSENT